MKRHCTETEWDTIGVRKIMEGVLGEGATACGRDYDDLTNSTICPHDELPRKLSYEELEAKLNGEAPMVAAPPINGMQINSSSPDAPGTRPAQPSAGSREGRLRR